MRSGCFKIEANLILVNYIRCIDIVGDATPDRYKIVLQELEEEKFFDVLLLILTPQTMTQPEKVAEMLSDFSKKSSKPCFACFMGGKSVAQAKSILQQKNIANFDEPEFAAQVLSIGVRQDKWLEKEI